MLSPVISRVVQSADMIFVQHFTLQDFQGKDFTLKNCVIGDIFHF